MSNLMLGLEVARAMKDTMLNEVEKLKANGISPCLTIIRVGNKPDDLAYERGALKRMDMLGISCNVIELPEDVKQAELENVWKEVNENPEIHGILLFRPLPVHLDEEPLKRSIHPWKDVDCMNPLNLAKVFLGDEAGFAPCTAEAVVEMLDHYEIDVCGKNVVVVGRSMVIGKPVSMLLLKRNATVTICHTRTKNIEEVCRRADIVVAAAGVAKMISAEMVSEHTIVVDVGINVDMYGNLCGDVDFDAVCDKVSYISPVPRGVGSVTTSVLAKHVIRSAKYLNNL